MVTFMGRMVALLWGMVANLYIFLYLVAPYSFEPIFFLSDLALWLLLVSTVIFGLAVGLRASGGILLWLMPGFIAFIVWFLPAWLPQSTPDVEGTELTVVTFNVYGYHSDADQVLDVIRQIDGDVIGLQELDVELATLLKENLLGDYPYQAFHTLPDTAGYGLLSKFPIQDYDVRSISGLGEAPYDASRYLRAHIDLNNRPVIIYVYHAPTVRPQPSEAPLRLFYNYGNDLQKAAFSYLTMQVEKETSPVLLLCDCNCTPRSESCHLLGHSFESEVFGEQGQGWGLTLPAHPIPFVRVDYIWYTRDFVAVAARTWESSGTSDHLPVKGELVLVP